MDELLLLHALGAGTTAKPWFDMYGSGTAGGASGATYNDYGGFNSATYDYFGFGGGASAGGASSEVGFGAPTTTPAYRPKIRSRTRTRSGKRRNRPRPRPPVVTPAPTTTTPPPPTTPEPADEPDMMGLLTMMARTMGGNTGFGTGFNSAPTAPAASSKSYCYCSPLSSCPRGSVARGGNCQNFISFFLNIKYQRCCYRPSVLKRYGF